MFHACLPDWKLLQASCSWEYSVLWFLSLNLRATSVCHLNLFGLLRNCPFCQLSLSWEDKYMYDMCLLTSSCLLLRWFYFINVHERHIVPFRQPSKPTSSDSSWRCSWVSEFMNDRPAVPFNYNCSCCFEEETLSCKLWTLWMDRG